MIAAANAGFAAPSDGAPLHVALIGYGYWGPNLLRNFMELRGVWVSWVCDLRPESLAKAKGRCAGLHTTQDVDDVLAATDVDAVVIATPIGTHYELAAAALKAGKHVFVEKPMTADIGQAESLIDLAAARELTLMVGHTFVFSPPVRKVKELIDDGTLGDIYFLTSQRVNLGLHQKDVSVVWDLAPHDISILQYWLGETADSVSTMGRGCVVADIPDVAFINLRFPSGVVAEIQASWLSPMKLRRTIVVGSRRMLVYDDTESVEKVKLFDHGVDFREPSDFGEFQLSYRTGDIISPHIAGAEPLALEAAHFVECVRSGAQPITDGAAGLSVVASLAAAEASLRGGGVAVSVGGRLHGAGP